MPDEYYKLIAGGARYWFLLLMIIIVLRSIRWYHADRRSFMLRMKNLPADNIIGQMVLIRGVKVKQIGRVYPVPLEGSIGKSFTNDICIKSKSMENVSALFYFEEGNGLCIKKAGKKPIGIDGYAVGEETAYMFDQSILWINGVELCLHLNSELHCPNVFQVYKIPENVQPAPETVSSDPEDENGGFAPEKKRRRGAGR